VPASANLRRASLIASLVLLLNFASSTYAKDASASSERVLFDDFTYASLDALPPMAGFRARRTDGPASSAHRGLARSRSSTIRRAQAIACFE
jgi:hypothetical protein